MLQDGERIELRQETTVVGDLKEVLGGEEEMMRVVEAEKRGGKTVEEAAVLELTAAVDGSETKEGEEELLQ